MFKKPFSKLSTNQRIISYLILAGVFVIFFSITSIIKIICFSPPFLKNEYKKICELSLIMGRNITANGDQYKVVAINGLSLFKNNFPIYNQRTYFGMSNEQNSFTSVMIISGYFSGKTQAAYMTRYFDDDNDGIPDRKDRTSIKEGNLFYEDLPLSKEDFEIWNYRVIQLIESLDEDFEV